MKTNSNSTKRWAVRGLAFVWMLAGLFVMGCQPADQDNAEGEPSGVAIAESKPAEVDSNQTAKIVIRLAPDSGPIEIELPVTGEMTVLDLMNQAQREGKLEFEYRGSGATVFVNSIQGLANQGAGGHNWIYRVNGKLGDRSIGVAEIVAGDKITWEFGSYEPGDDSESPPPTDADADSSAESQSSADSESENQHSGDEQR